MVKQTDLKPEQRKLSLIEDHGFSDSYFNINKKSDAWKLIYEDFLNLNVSVNGQEASKTKMNSDGILDKTIACLKEGTKECLLCEFTSICKPTRKA